MFDFDKQVVRMAETGRLTAREVLRLCKAVGVPERQAAVHVITLIKAGRLRQVRLGLYAATPEGLRWVSGWRWS